MQCEAVSSAPRVLATSEDVRICSLWRWFRQHGGRAPNVVVRTEGGLRGLYAQTGIADGDTLLHVPRRLLLTMDVAREGRYGRLMRAAEVELHDDTHLALFLIEVRRDGGFWAPYVDSLPSSFDELPIRWPASDWSELDGSCTQRMARGLFANLRADFRRVRAVLPAADHISLREFVWGWMAASTRSFNLSMDGRPMPALVPLADMANCTEDECVYWSGDNSQAFEYKARGTLRARQQLTGAYATAPNNMRLAQYGFTLAGNWADEVRVHVTVPPGHFAESTQVAYDGMAPGRAYDVRLDYRHDGLRRLLSFLRLSTLPDIDTAARHLALQAADPCRLPPLDPCNERMALDRLHAACAQRLTLFKHTIDEDDALLAQGDLPFRRRQAITARRGEKHLLHELMGFAAKASALLTLPVEARAHALAQGAAAGGPMAGWFEHCLATFRVVYPAG
jgi:hypothetical protein